MARTRKLRKDRGASAGLGGRASFYMHPVQSGPANGGPQAVDILHETPRAWPDLRGAAGLVRFAFEGGDCEGVFDALIEALPLAPTELMAEAFASQLYLDELVESCLAVRIDGARYAPNPRLLRRVLETPPAGPEDCAARQRALGELAANGALRGDLERLYLSVLRLRAALEASTALEPNLVRRKINVLSAMQQCVDAMADGFAGSVSVLARLREDGLAARATTAWPRLVRLIDLEGNLATVDLRLQLGSDGTVRGFSVLALQENRGDNVFPGPARRLWQRFVAYLRGHRYGESEVVVRLLDEVFAPLADRAVGLLALTGSLEFYLAGLSFRDLARSRGREVSLPEIVAAPPPGAGAVVERRIEELFNPLLFLQDITPVPCDVSAARHDALVVLTGPNSGGKTRFLQALALTQLLGQVGLFVPAARARLVRAPRLFLSLVTEDDAAQPEGRLGTELARIRRLFEQLEPGAMVLLDEFCSGTNPAEGEAIFEMVVGLLPRLGPQVYVSTHFLGLAARLERERPAESLEFLRVELDAREQPTFQFVPGVATTSLAHKVAERLGVTPEALRALVDAKLARR